jgi:lysophospholipase L1-like esterase
LLRVASWQKPAFSGDAKNEMMFRQVPSKQSLLRQSLVFGGNAGFLFALTFLWAGHLLGQETKSWSESQIDSSRFEGEIERLEAKIFDPPPGPIVFYGSSSFRLWKSLEQDFPSYEVLNCGFGGACIADCVAFAPRLILPLKPSAVVLYAGDNDLALGISAEQAFDSFCQLFHILRDSADGSQKPFIAFVSVKACPARIRFLASIQRYNSLVREFMSQQPGCDFIDLYSDLLGPDKKPLIKLFRNDHIHLSTDGYQILHRDIAQFLRDDFPKSLATQ